MRKVNPHLDYPPEKRRYMPGSDFSRVAVLSGHESEGHLTGDAIKALFKNGVDKNKRIIGTQARHPLFTISRWSSSSGF
jgi:hypothetical protein